MDDSPTRALLIGVLGMSAPHEVCTASNPYLQIFDKQALCSKIFSVWEVFQMQNGSMRFKGYHPRSVERISQMLPVVYRHQTSACTTLGNRNELTGLSLYHE